MVHDPRLYSPQTTVAILAVLDWLCGEVERDERAPGPIEKARWEAKVPRQRQPTEAIIPWRTPCMPTFGSIQKSLEKRELRIRLSMHALSKHLRSK
jgi:hypothetical protein